MRTAREDALAKLIMESGLIDDKTIIAAQAAEIERLKNHLVVAESLLSDAEKRIEPFAKCWREETTMEEAITLDDLALGATWIEMYDLYQVQK